MKLQRLINEFYNRVGKLNLGGCGFPISLFKIANSQNTQFSTAWLILQAFTKPPRKILISDVSITPLSAKLTKVIKTVAKVRFREITLRVYPSAIEFSPALAEQLRIRVRSEIIHHQKATLFHHLTLSVSPSAFFLNAGQPNQARQTFV